MSAQTAADLTAARDLILRYGWIQGHWGDAGRGFCAFGALCETGLGRPSGAAYEALRAVTHPGPITWNDEPGRTKAEVIAAFDKAIAAEESTS